MPYFLVTLSSIIEASDEEAAAKAALAHILDGPTVAFDVRRDEETIRRVVITANETPDGPDIGLVQHAGEANVEATEAPEIARLEPSAPPGEGPAGSKPNARRSSIFSITGICVGIIFVSARIFHLI